MEYLGLIVGGFAVIAIAALLLEKIVFTRTIHSPVWSRLVAVFFAWLLVAAVASHGDVDPDIAGARAFAWLIPAAVLVAIWFYLRARKIGARV
ncbi:hypothetical protein [Sphingomonas sp.]|jgi:hypothetical protein|uniref:hypothetical protein n=1 Tax=Sphingomonas sp. TaxID=28214 RepID=UPI003D6D1E1C